MSALGRWSFVSALAVLLTAVPIAYYRYGYERERRLREVTPGVFYRSGQMTAKGFEVAVARYGLRTIVNLQDEFPDPNVQTGFLSSSSIKETALCSKLGVRYVYIAPDLIPRRHVPEQRPRAIDRFLAVLDDPSAYPILIHCKAGLHRTGVMTAVYRMERMGWTPHQALEELRLNGFGDFASTSANDYIMQYILTYRPGVRQTEVAAHRENELP